MCFCSGVGGVGSVSAAVFAQHAEGLARGGGVVCFFPVSQPGFDGVVPLKLEEVVMLMLMLMALNCLVHVSQN